MYFKDGLQRWVEPELNRCNVQTVEESLAASESLQEYSSNDTRKGKNKKRSSHEKGGEVKPHSNKSNDNIGKEEV